MERGWWSETDMRAFRPRPRPYIGRRDGTEARSCEILGYEGAWASPLPPEGPRARRIRDAALRRWRCGQEPPRSCPGHSRCWRFSEVVRTRSGEVLSALRGLRA